MSTLRETIKAHESLLADMARRHEETIASANRQLQNLIDSAENGQIPEAKPDSAWIEKDGEKYLLMNGAAVDAFQSMFDQFKAVIEELIAKEKRVKP